MQKITIKQNKYKIHNNHLIKECINKVDIHWYAGPPRNHLIRYVREKKTYLIKNILTEMQINNEL